MAKQHERKAVTFMQVLNQARRTCEMAQQCKDDGCDYPELSGALGKFIGGLSALERRSEPGGSMVAFRKLEDDE